MQIIIKKLLFKFNIKKLKKYFVIINIINEKKYEYMKKKWRLFEIIRKLYNIIKYIHENLQ